VELQSLNGLSFPLTHLGAEGSAQIGGLIATNAGGSLAMRNGMMEAQMLGLEVVLPDGSIWDGMRALIKDNTGIQLRKLFCGAEGRLGAFTRAACKSRRGTRQGFRWSWPRVLSPALGPHSAAVHC
jgi:FAD/FMN-containing dehydrogenase